MLIYHHFYVPYENIFFHLKKTNINEYLKKIKL